MHIFLDNFHQSGKYSARIASHQTELRREETFTDQNALSILSLQTYYLNIDISSSCGKNSERAKYVQTKCTFCECANHSAEKNSKGSESKSKNIVGMVIRTTDKRNVRLGNALDVDLKIT